jgi:hypothetical protein
MKKTTLLLLLVVCFVKVFAQENKEILKAKSYSITNFYHKGITYTDTNSYDVEMPMYFADSPQRRGILSKSFADAIFKTHTFTLDSIPETATVIINGIRFESKKILSKMANFEVLLVKKDSSFTYIYNQKRDDYDTKVSYKRPRSIVYQAHENFPADFVVFEPNSLEMIRYKCFSNSPILDVFNTEDSVVLSHKPRVIIDGRLQSKSFDYQNINLQNVKKIDVFGKEIASNYFGFKVQSGLVSVITENANFNLEWILANTRVIGEIQDKNGDWKVLSDTVITSLEQFKKFRKKTFQDNGAVYLINGEFENEKMNRKTFALDAVESIRVASGKVKIRTVKNENAQAGQRRFDFETVTVENDTVFIQTEKERWTSKATISLPKIMSELNRLRRTTPEPSPIYIIDSQEVDAEKLKEFKSKELEFVESLEGCDAISKYGKRAEMGVVIYRRKK